GRLGPGWLGRASGGMFRFGGRRCGANAEDRRGGRDEKQRGSNDMHVTGLVRWMIGVTVVGALACGGRSAGTQTATPRPSATAVVRPGITVLLDDSLALIRGKRIGLLTNQTGIDEHGVSDIELLRGP